MRLVRIATIVMTAAAIAAAGLIDAAPAQPAASASVPVPEQAQGGVTARVIEVSAERFAFTPSEIKVKAGTPIEFRLRSDDTSHGFRILDTAVNVRIPKRGKGVTTVLFEPPKPGRYTFECSKLCGAGHSFMRGTLIVTE